MGLRESVAKLLLTQLFLKGAPRCTTLAFFLVLGEGVEGAFLKECEAAFLQFPTHVVNKIWQGGRYRSKEYCCETRYNITNY